MRSEFENVVSVSNEDLNAIIPDVRRFSKWTKFIRATAWVLKAIDRLNKIICKFILNELLSKAISRAELKVFKNNRSCNRININTN